MILSIRSGLRRIRTSISLSHSLAKSILARCRVKRASDFLLRRAQQAAITIFTTAPGLTVASKNERKKHEFSSLSLSSLPGKNLHFHFNPTHSITPREINATPDARACTSFLLATGGCAFPANLPRSQFSFIGLVFFTGASSRPTVPSSNRSSIIVIEPRR